MGISKTVQMQSEKSKNLVSKLPKPFKPSKSNPTPEHYNSKATFSRSSRKTSMFQHVLMYPTIPKTVQMQSEKSKNLVSKLPKSFKPSKSNPTPEHYNSKATFSRS